MHGSHKNFMIKMTLELAILTVQKFIHCNFVNNVNLLLQEKKTVLHYAASCSDNTEIVEILVKSGVDVNAVDKVS